MFWSIPLQCCLRARRNTEVPQAGGGDSNLVHQVPKQEVTRRHGGIAVLPHTSLSILSMPIPPQPRWNCWKPGRHSHKSGLFGATMVNSSADLHGKLKPVPRCWSTSLTITNQTENKKKKLKKKMWEQNYLSLPLQVSEGGFSTPWLVIR